MYAYCEMYNGYDIRTFTVQNCSVCDCNAQIPERASFPLPQQIYKNKRMLISQVFHLPQTFPPGGGGGGANSLPLFIWPPKMKHEFSLSCNVRVTRRNTVKPVYIHAYAYTKYTQTYTKCVTQVYKAGPGKLGYFFPL